MEQLATAAIEVKQGFRLRRSADVKRTRRHGKVLTHSMLTIHVYRREADAPKVGVVAGRSIGGAVTRNRAKRIMRAAVQSLLDRVKPEYDLLLVARPAIRDATSTQVASIVRNLLGSAGVLVE